MVGPIRRYAAAFVTMVSIVSAAFSAAGAVVWVKADTDANAMLRELQFCTDESHLVGVEINMSRTNVSAPGGILIGALVGAGFSAAMKPKAQSDYQRDCMLGRGFRAIRLSSIESNQLDALAPPDARSNWLMSFYARPDFDQRRAATLAPPDARTCAPGGPCSNVTNADAIGATSVGAMPDPYAFAGVKFDPAALTVSTGELKPVSAILSGPADHRRTGRLIGARGFNGYRADDGLVVHKVVMSGPEGGNQVYWCGHLSRLWPDGFNDHCLWSGPSGVRIYPGRDVPWLDAPAFTDAPSKQTSASFGVSESEDDLIGRMDFGIFLKKVAPQFVEVVAEAKFEGHYDDFWIAVLPFDDQGRAILPFWDYRLTLTRSAGGVTATFTKDGNGTGWSEVKAK